MSGKFNYINEGTCRINPKIQDIYDVLTTYSCTIHDVVNLCGGVPAANISILNVGVTSPGWGVVEVLIVPGTKSYLVNRRIDFLGKKIINSLMYVYDKGNGIGLNLFLNQVKQARTMGFTLLEVEAAGYPGQTEWDGYYFWARMGYEMTDPDDIKEVGNLLKTYHPPAKSLSELVLTDKGYQFWKDNGFPWAGRFLLADDSPNMKHLAAYLTMKGIDFAF